MVSASDRKFARFGWRSFSGDVVIFISIKLNSNVIFVKDFGVNPAKGKRRKVLLHPLVKMSVGPSVLFLKILKKSTLLYLHVFLHALSKIVFRKAFPVTNIVMNVCKRCRLIYHAFRIII